MALRRNINIIVVDDMSVSRQLLIQMLEQMGIDAVRAVADAPSAVAMLRSFRADIVVADLNMPGTDGLELLRQVRADPRTARIGFVLTSGHDTDDRIAEAWHAGLDRFLAKPFDFQRFVVALEAVSGRL